MVEYTRMVCVNTVVSLNTSPVCQSVLEYKCRHISINYRQIVFDSVEVITILYMSE